MNLNLSLLTGKALNSLNGVIAYATLFCSIPSTTTDMMTLNSLNGVIAYATSSLQTPPNKMLILALNSLNGVIAYATVLLSVIEAVQRNSQF
ncbi:MAG: hypothetical protein NZ888_08345, partial [Candidatus Nitrosocaldus sp.]|nr:hypothetical protein [Candidatus Nitrosocaldus sp.]